MFVIIGNDTNAITMLDTTDKTVEKVKPADLQRAIKAGMQIRGLQADGTPLCTTPDVFTEIADKLKGLIAMGTLLGVDGPALSNKARDIAEPYGLCDTADDVTVNAKAKTIYFKIMARVVSFESNGTVNVSTATVGVKRRKDIYSYGYRAKEVAAIENAMNYVIVADKNANKDNIVRYIGETPGNNLYKFMIGKYVYSISVEHSYNVFSPFKTYDTFGNAAELNTAKQAVIKKLVTGSSAQGYEAYLIEKLDTLEQKGKSCANRSIYNDAIKDDWIITKLSKKTIKAENPKEGYRALKAKYSTLSDIYIDLED